MTDDRRLESVRKSRDAERLRADRKHQGIAEVRGS